MPFEPGQSGNLNGRPRGSQNQEIKSLREKINFLLEDRFDKIIEDLDDLNPKERIDVYVKLLEYTLPKLNRTTIQGDHPTMTVEDARETLIEKIMALENSQE